LLTGHESDLAVVRVEAAAGGLETWAKLASNHETELTPVVSTVETSGGAPRH
jgi:hypothetical protein